MAGYKRHPRYTELFKPAASSVWWMFVPNPVGGKALRESTRQHDDVAAHSVYLARIRAAPASAEGKERRLGDALKGRLAWLRSNQGSKDPTRKRLASDTIEFYEKKGRPLVEYFGEDALLSSIDAEAIRAYVTERTKGGVAGTSIAKELTTLSMAVKLAHKDGVRCQLIRDIKPEDFNTSYVPRERWLAMDEYDRFMNWWYANRSAAKGAVLDFIVSTGATCPSEVYRTKRDEADPKTFQVHIRGTKRERRDRTFIVPSDRRRYFTRALKHADGAPKSGMLFGPAWGNIRRDILIGCAYLSMCGACQRAGNLWWFDAAQGAYAKSSGQVFGTPVCDPHCKDCRRVPELKAFCPTDLRRTFAQWLMQAGVPYELAYPLMGHEDDRMLKMVYGRRSATDVGPLIEAVLARAARPAKVSGDSRVIAPRRKPVKAEPRA